MDFHFVIGIHVGKGFIGDKILLWITCSVRNWEIQTAKSKSQNRTPMFSFFNFALDF